MDWAERLRRVRQDIEGLSRSPVVSGFLVRYLWVAYEHMERCSPEAERLLTAFEALTAFELWHHKAMQKLSTSPKLQGLYLVPLGVEMRSGLLRLIRRLEKLSAFVPDEVIVREMLKAHCYYCLGETEGVIRCLEEAINQGANHPILYFALGYNRHRNALQSYARWEADRQRFVVTDKEAFERELHQALKDFQTSLDLSGENDGQLHFWIGIVHELLGDVDEAIAAYERAREIDPKTFGEEVEERLRRLQRKRAQQKGLPLSSPELREERRPFPRITDKEMEQLRRAVEQAETISDLFKKLGGETGIKGGEN